VKKVSNVPQGVSEINEIDEIEIAISQDPRGIFFEFVGIFW
jgi:hypothetical protein